MDENRKEVSLLGDAYQEAITPTNVLTMSNEEIRLAKIENARREQRARIASKWGEKSKGEKAVDSPVTPVKAAELASPPIEQLRKFQSLQRRYHTFRLRDSMRNENLCLQTVDGLPCIVCILRWQNTYFSLISPV